MSNNTTNSSAYVPGVCNINAEEVTRRRNTGYIGLFFAIVYVGACLTLTDMRGWRLLVVVPAFMAAIGFLQAKHNFCVGYGSAGKQNTEPGSTQAHTVTNEASLIKDRAQARRLNKQALLIAAITGLISLALPSLV